MADYIPDDSEATLLLDSVEGEQDAGRKATMIDLLGRYRESKRAAGLEPFAPDPVAVVQRRDRVEGLFGGLDTVDSQLDPEQRKTFAGAVEASADRDEVKARMVNQSWVLSEHPELADLVDTDWTTVKQRVAKAVFGSDATEIPDTAFYAQIGGHIKKQQAAQVAATEMLMGVQEVAFGEEAGDWLTAYKKHAAKLDAIEGLSPEQRDHYRGLAQKTFAEAQAKTSELKYDAETLLMSLGREEGTREGYENARGISKAEQMDILTVMSAEDRQLLYRMIAKRAPTSPETAEAHNKGAMEKVGDKFMRDLQALATDQIQSFEQTMVGGRMDYARRAQAGEEAYMSGSDLIPRSDIPGINPATSDDVLNRLGFRKASKEDIAAFSERAKEAETRYRVALELRDLADGVIDPAKFSNRFIEGVTNAPGQVAYSAQMAIPFAGVALFINGTMAQRTRELMGRGVPLEQAREISLASAITEMPMEWVQSKMLFGRLPGMQKVLSAPLKQAGLPALLKRTGKVFTAEYALQNLQELGQDGTNLVFQEAVSSWDDSVPETTKESWKQFWSERVDTAYTMLPITMVGTGAGAFRDQGFARQYLSNKTVLTAAGFTPKVVDQIAEVAATGDIERAQSMVQQAWEEPQMRPRAIAERETKAAVADVAAYGQFNSDEQKRAFDELDSEMQASYNEQQNPTGARAERNEDGSWSVLDNEGQLVDRTTDAEQAVELVKQVDQADSANLTGLVEDMIDYFNQRGRGGEIEITGDIRTLADKVDEGTMTEETAKKIVDLYLTLGALPAGTTPREARIYGESEKRYNAREKVFEYVSRLHDGADPLVLVEEEAEGYFKSALDAGQFSLEQVESWRAEVEGKHVVRNKDEAMRHRENVEWFSTYAKAYITGKTQAGANVPLTFRRWLERVKRVFAEVFKLAHELMEREKAGKLPAEFRKHLARSVGLDEAFIERRMRDEERTEIEQDNVEISDWIDGRLPHPESAGATDYSGELAKIYDSMVKVVKVERENAGSAARRGRNARSGYKIKNKSSANAFFANKTEDINLGAVLLSAKEAGFGFESVEAMLEAVNLSMSGIEVFAHPVEDMQGDNANEQRGAANRTMAVRKKPKDDTSDIFDSGLASEDFKLWGGTEEDASGTVDVEEARREAKKRADAAQGEMTFSLRPEQQADRAEYDRLQSEMKALGYDKVGTPEFNALWQASEDIKNRNGGMPPGEVAGGESTFSIGPANRADDVKAAMRSRMIGIRVQVSTNFADEVKALVGQPQYEVRGMDVNEKEARKIIEQHDGDLTKLMDLLNDPTQTMHPATKVALAFFVAEAANKVGDYARAAEVAKNAAEQATSAGQSVNELKRWSVFTQPETCQQLLQTEIEKENARRKEREPAINAVVTAYADVQKEALKLLKRWLDEINGFTAGTAKPVTADEVAELADVTFSLRADIKESGLVQQVAKMLKKHGADATERALMEKYGAGVEKHLPDLFIEAQRTLTEKPKKTDKKFKTRTPALPEAQIERTLASTRGKTGQQEEIPTVEDLKKRGMSDEEIERTLAQFRNRQESQPDLISVEQKADGSRLTPDEIQAAMDAQQQAGAGAQSLADLPELYNRLVEHLMMKLKDANVPVARGIREQIMEVLNRHGLQATEKDVKLIVGARQLLDDMTPAQAEELANFAKRIASTPLDSFERGQQTMELFSYVHEQLAPYDMIDTAFALWYANVLSSLITSARNITGNAGMLFLDQATETIFRNPATYWPYVMEMAKAVDSGVDGAKAQAANTIRTGQEGLHRSQTLADERRQGALESKTAPLAKVRAISRTATRFLAVQDLFFANTAYEMKARQLAWDQANRETAAGVLKPEEVAERVNRLLNAATDQIQTFEDRAAVEWGNLTPEIQATYQRDNWIKRRVSELRLFQRDKQLVSRALDFAQKATLDFEPEGLMGLLIGSLGKAFSTAEKAAQEIPDKRVRLVAKGVARYGRTRVIPFMRVPVNVFNRALDYGPVGYGRALLDAAGVPVIQGSKTRVRSAEERSDMLKRATLGTLAMLPLMLFTRPPDPDEEGEEVPWLQIHGAGSGTPQKNLALNGPKYRAYSLELRIGGNQVFIDYRMAPIAPYLAAIGTLHDQTRYKKTEDKTAVMQGWLVAHALKEAFLSSSPITSLRELSEAVAENRPMSERAVKRTAARGTVGVVSNLIPLSGLWRSLDQLAGGNRNTRDTFMAASLAEIPVASRLNVPSVDVLGDTMISRTGIGWLADWSKMETPESRIYLAFAEKDVTPSDISRYQSKLTPEDYYMLAKERGAALKDALLAPGENGRTGLDTLIALSDKAPSKDGDSPAKIFLQRISLAATRRALAKTGLLEKMRDDAEVKP